MTMKRSKFSHYIGVVGVVGLVFALAKHAVAGSVWGVFLTVPFLVLYGWLAFSNAPKADWSEPQ